MSKRDIPEINAGSMADIAFLLLIFFLVTTTMDIDKAYMRPIPKKLDVQIDPPPIMERDIFEIQANSSNKLMVRKKEVKNPDDISDMVLEFFRKNEKLTQSQMIAASTDKSSAGFEFPFYNQYSMAQIEKKIEELTLNAEAIENTPGMDEALIAFEYSKVDDWTKKKKNLQFYGKPYLPEISQQAHIRIVVQTKTGYELFAKIQSEIEEALYELRDDAAQRIWGESYGKIVTKIATEPDKSEEYVKMKELLEALYPARIIEVTPKN